MLTDALSKLLITQTTQDSRNHFEHVNSAVVSRHRIHDRSETGTHRAQSRRSASTSCHFPFTVRQAVGTSGIEANPSPPENEEADTSVHRIAQGRRCSSLVVATETRPDVPGGSESC